LLQKTRALGHIESIRALAAISVAMFHFINHSVGEKLLVQNDTIRSISEYGAQGVELFFIISGFIIPYALFNGKYHLTDFFRYIAKRFIRLFPPYIATIFAIHLVGFILCKLIWKIDFDIHWKQMAANILFLADFFPTIDWINPIFITLKVEVQFYILIGLFFPFFIKNKTFLYCSIFIFIAIGIITQNHYTVFSNSPYFFIGLMSFFIYSKGWKAEYITALIFIFIILALYYLPEDFIVALLGVALLLGLPNNFKPLQFTGKISYSLYLIHGLIGGWFLYFTSDFNLWKNYNWVMIFLAFLLSWFGAFVFYLCIEKPCLKISGRIKYGSIKTKS